jgi:HAD superfamily hydrolase (TIGR01509 family)
MDGTLVDSGDLHYEAWRATLAELGRPLGRAAFNATFGQRNDAVLRQLVDPDIGAAEVTRIGDAKEAHYRALVRRHGIALLPGAATWLARLADGGWLQAIASSGPRLNTATVLDTLALRERFAAVVAAEDVAHGKPHPEVFLTAAARLGVTPTDCVVVEDAPPGLEAGRRAGMRTLGVLSTHPHLDADRVVAALDQLEAEAFAALLGRG